MQIAVMRRRCALLTGAMLIFSTAGCYNVSKNKSQNDSEGDTASVPDESSDGMRSSDSNAPSTDTGGQETDPGEPSTETTEIDTEPRDTGSDTVLTTDGADTVTDLTPDTDTDTMFNPGIEWVPIPAGTFQMGSKETEYGRSLNERAHPVTLTHDFEIAATEVTFAQWTALGFPLPDNDSLCETTDCPVQGLYDRLVYDWLDALSARNGFERCYESDGNPYVCNGYRLPTEAEWEYAARGESTAATYNGDFTEASAAAVLANIAACGQSDYTALPTGRLAPNAFGLYDMIGNLEEIAEWGGTYPDASLTDPYYAPRSERFIALRGGSRSTETTSCRAAYRTGALRYTNEATSHMNRYTFRPVRTISDGDPIGTAVQDSECTELATASCDNFGVEASHEILSAASLGTSITLQGMALYSGSMTGVIGLLGESKEGETSSTFLAVGTLGSTESGATVEDLTMYPLQTDLTDVHPIDLEAIRGNDGTKMFAALVCAEHCFLASSAATAEEPSPFEKIPGSDVPDGLNPVAVSAESGLSGNIIAVGDGVARFANGEWTMLISPADGQHFNQIAKPDYDTETVSLIAVGNGGLIAVGDADHWRKVQSDVTENLYDVRIRKVIDQTIDFEAVGENGRMVSGTENDLVSCRIFDKDLLYLGLTQYGQYTIYVSNAAEQIYASMRNDGTPPCIAAALPKRIVQFDVYTCGIANNPIYLTDTAVLGDWRCMID